MSNPLSNLRRTKKSPFPQGKSRAVPFRQPDYYEDDDKLLDEVTGYSSSRLSYNDQHRKHVGLQLPKLSTGNSAASSPPGDFELMTSMMNKIALLEKKILYYSKEIMDKDKKIQILEEKVQLLQKYRGTPTDESIHVQELEKKCLSLQNQVQDMEEFLADYGMVWVGKSSPRNEMYDGSEFLSDDDDGEDDEMWRPGTSVPPPAFQFDFDIFLQNVKDLNVLAGEGVQKIEKTMGGARLRHQEPIPLILYGNGIVMFSGPFRSYDEPVTQHCINDIMDGYFPSELQDRYPDGVPIQVTDRRDVFFEDKRRMEHFPGVGQMLGGDHKPSILVPSRLRESQDKPTQITSQLPGPQLTVEQFLTKLPLSVVKSGKVIDVRHSVGDTIKQGERGQVETTVIETQALKEMKDRVDIAPSQRPKSSKDVATLRIKGESGDKVFVLKMKFNDTIGDVRKYVDKHRTKDAAGYDILTTFPNKVYCNEMATLEECGLTPNATLHLRPIKKR